ncbi:MAG: hypothetical protein FGM52_11810, partial [Mycobacterium sp.]|nr:hypothetical protein [Mycobacterium sp.]
MTFTPCAPRNRSASASSRSALRATITRSWPCAANWRANSAPIPVEAPVISVAIRSGYRQVVPRPQRVRGVDASFLALETANQPIQVFTVMELDPSTFPGGYSFERMREMLAEHARAIPALRERLSGNRWDLDHPSWVADDDFDITRHVRRIALRSALDRAELTTLCGRLGALPLDRRHPLWEMWVIEGTGGGAGTAQVAVLLKLHHAAADGVTFVK